MLLKSKLVYCIYKHTYTRTHSIPMPHSLFANYIDEIVLWCAFHGVSFWEIRCVKKSESTSLHRPPLCKHPTKLQSLELSALIELFAWHSCHFKMMIYDIAMRWMMISGYDLCTHANAFKSQNRNLNSK